MATNIFIGKKPISTSNSGSSSGTGNGLTPEQELKVNSLKINGNGDKALFDDGTYQDIVTQDELDAIEQFTDDLSIHMIDHENDMGLHLSSTDRNLLTSLNHNKGTFESEANLRATYPTANAGDYCICYNGTNYTMWTYSTDWVDTGVQGNVTSVNNLTGDITLDSTNINYITGVTLKEKIDEKLENNNFIQGENITIATDVNGDLKIDCDIIIEEVTEEDIDALF